MVLARSSRNIDQKHCIGNFEFTLTPRVLFAPGGSLLLCQDKAKLTHSLEMLLVAAEGTCDNSQPTSHKQCDVPDRRIAVVDGMVVVQKLTKNKATMATVKDLSVCFIQNLMNITAGYDEIILVFDTYKVDSLKKATRQKRCGIQDPVQYQIRDETSIKHISIG